MATKKNLNVVPSKETESLDVSEGRMKLGAYSLPSLATKSGYIEEEAKQELKFPRAINLYKQMGRDPNIASAIGVIETMISRVSWEVKVPKTASKEEQERCKKLNYNLKILDRSWEEYILEMTSFLQYGFSPLEKIYKEIDTAKHGKFKGWKDFSPIAQETVDRWVYDETTGELIGIIQDLTRINTDFRTKTYDKKVGIPIKKIMNFRNNPKRNNPQGTSPLVSCYIPYKYSTLVAEIEAVGVAKDLRGVPKLGVEASFLARASVAGSDEEATLNELTTQASNLSANDQAYVICPLQYDDKGMPLFTFELMGVQGGQKNFSTDEILKRYSNSILQCFFADVLKLGQDAHGSFSLASSKTSLLAFGVESHLKTIQRTLNHDLIPQTYRLNGWEYDPDTSCRFEHGDIEDAELEELSKAVQRCVSTGAIRPTEDVESFLRHQMFKLESVSESGTKLLDTESTSRASDGMKTGSGNGTSTSPAGRDNSTSNSENASGFTVIKTLEDFSIVKNNRTGKEFNIPTEDLEDFISE